MKPFAYARASTVDDAVAMVGHVDEATFFAGGTTLLDLMKLDVLAPRQLVDINSLDEAAIEAEDDGLTMGALARMSDVAAHPAVSAAYPAIAEALLASASPQIRNMASIGGNLMQRTRCPYFRDTFWPCNKRAPGTGCSALDGEHRMHAILGVSEHCIAAHPSDLAVALAALDAVIQVHGPDGRRSIPFDDFYLLPSTTPHLETTLARDELITAVFVPSSPVASRCHYLKVRDRASYEFALVSVAAGLVLKNGVVEDCRIALGGVGAKPWRVKDAEAVLRGQPCGLSNYAAAAELALAGARPRPHNGFKVELAKRAIVRALQTAEGRS